MTPSKNTQADTSATPGSASPDLPRVDDPSEVLLRHGPEILTTAREILDTHAQMLDRLNKARDQIVGTLEKMQSDESVDIKKKLKDICFSFQTESIKQLIRIVGVRREDLALPDNSERMKPVDSFYGATLPVLLGDANLGLCHSLADAVRKGIASIDIAGRYSTIAKLITPDETYERATEELRRFSRVLHDFQGFCSAESIKADQDRWHVHAAAATIQRNAANSFVKGKGKRRVHLPVTARSGKPHVPDAEHAGREQNPGKGHDETRGRGVAER